MRPVNLLPEGARPRRRGGAASNAAYVLCGMLAALLLLLVVYALTTNQANSRTTDAAVARQEADGLETRTASLSPFGNFAQVKAARLASVRQLAGGRFDWERFMRELSRVVPKRTWLTATSASATGDLANAGSSSGSSSGSSGSSSSSSSATSAAGSTAGAQPAAQIVGCTKRQTTVAKIMVRLRQLYRVQDVALNQSSEEGDEKPTVDNCGRYYKFDLAVTFQPPPASGEAPEGRRRVPASLGGGS
jgi:hypothetical protein